MISTMLLSMAMSSTMVPPGYPVVNHASPGKWAQPTVRLFERQGEDRDRQIAWEAYVKELDQLWLEYRMAGSTPAAFRKYLAAAGQAKRRYVFQDPYYLPIVDE
jgi:hypothetical protein